MYQNVRRTALSGTIDMLVAAAEQLYNSEQGHEKKMWVINYLAEHGFTFDMGR